MHNTKADVALMNISRDKNYFHYLVQYPKQKFFAFPQPQYVLSMFLNFGHFSASCSYKNGSYKKSVYRKCCLVYFCCFLQVCELAWLFSAMSSGTQISIY